MVGRATEHIADIVALVDTWWQEWLIASGRVFSNRDMAALPSETLTIYRPAPAWMWTSANVTPWILPCGKAVKPVNRHGTAHWGPGRPGWHIECSAMAIRGTW